MQEEYTFYTNNNNNTENITNNPFNMENQQQPQIFSNNNRFLMENNGDSNQNQNDPFLNGDVDCYLNLGGDEKQQLFQQAKIEEQEDDFIQKEEWVTNSSSNNNNDGFMNNNNMQVGENNNNNLIDQNNNIDANGLFQKLVQQQQNPPVMQKRSMKIKKEKAKQLAKAKKDAAAKQKEAELLLQKQQNELQQMLLLNQNNGNSADFIKQEHDTESTNESSQNNNNNGSSQNMVEEQPQQQSNDNNINNAKININSGNESAGSSMSSGHGVGVGKTDKNMQQKIRNRISAQNSRDRKKAYINEIEQKVLDYECNNKELNQQIQKLMDENKHYHLENKQLKKELQMLRKKYGEEDKESESFFSDPVSSTIAHNNNRRGSNYGALGLALFSIVSLIMMTNMNVDSKNGSSITLASLANNNGAKVDLSNQLRISNELNNNEFEQLDKDSEEYAKLRDIVEAKELQERQVPLTIIEEEEEAETEDFSSNKSTEISDEFEIKQEEESENLQQQQIIQNNNINNQQNIIDSMVIETSFEVVKATESSKFLQKQSQNNNNNNKDLKCNNCEKGLLLKSDIDASVVQENPIVSTIYCGEPYKYNPNFNVTSQQEKVKIGNFKENEWVQLFVKKEELNNFAQDENYGENNNIYVQRNKSVIGGDNLVQSDNTLVEVLAKVYSVKDVKTI